MIKFSRSRVRRAVQRAGSQRYILFVLLSFGASVSITRLFLSLTGYPKIGTGDLHIAHVLWGGLILFIASLFPLLFANRWALTASALLSGVGVGLFIDEVGKFITQNNNYFYPAAAPIVYGLFMLTVLLYTQVRSRRPHDVRTELYALFDELEEVLDFDLDRHEERKIVARLNHIRTETDQKDLLELVDSLEHFFKSRSIELVPDKPGFISKLVIKINAWLEAHVTENRLRAGVVGGLFAVGIWSFSYPVNFLAQVQNPSRVEIVLTRLVNQGMIKTDLGLHGLELRLALEISVGLIFLVSALLLMSRYESRGLGLGYIGLVFSLAVVNMVIFYFNQFSTIFNAIVQASLLLAIMYYRHRFHNI